METLIALPVFPGAPFVNYCSVLHLPFTRAVRGEWEWLGKALPNEAAGEGRSTVSGPLPAPSDAVSVRSLGRVPFPLQMLLGDRDDVHFCYNGIQY